jgi:putative restriction endonuclease
MAHCVFVHKADSIYDDIPAVRYQFPAPYLARAQQCVGDWVVYFEPVKVARSRGYFAVARVEAIVPDPGTPGRYRALIEPGTYLPFCPTVPRRVDGALVERDCPNAQWAVRPLSDADFARITALGLRDEELLPRLGEAMAGDRVHDLQAPYEIERTIIQSLVSRPFRDRAFRRAVLDAYDARCAVTGWKLINGGGRVEAEAAHIRPVERGGPDSVQNGIALSGTAHWMFDRGLIGFSDDLDILVSRQVNDRSGIEAIINPSCKALAPSRIALRPHPAFLGWHRENCFKH